MPEIIKVKLDVGGLGAPVAVIQVNDGFNVTQVVVQEKTAALLAVEVGKRLVEGIKPT